MANLIDPNCEIPVTGGVMDGYIAHPDNADARCGVLLFVELWGMTPHMREVAERLAQAGHIAVVCDLFRGTTPPVPQDPLEKWARTFEDFDDVSCTNDCRQAATWLKNAGSGRELEHVFAWGFCMGGRFAHNLGAISDAVSGVINFYGRINFPRMANKPFLPIELSGLINKPYLGAFAETDGLIPPTDIAGLRAGLSANPNARIDVYPGTEHAFFNDHREAYNAAAADVAWNKVLSFITEHS
jgi:carboxymethylenebutenolidase